MINVVEGILLVKVILVFIQNMFIQKLHKLLRLYRKCTEEARLD